jgi:hypothetical protein
LPHVLQSITVHQVAVADSRFVDITPSRTAMRPFLGLNLNLSSRSSRFLTGTQEKHVTKMILNDYLLMVTGKETVLREDKTVGTLLLTIDASNSCG